jgi:hypothetical protein
MARDHAMAANHLTDQLKQLRIRERIASLSPEYVGLLPGVQIDCLVLALAAFAE